jgi:hypothetical protein
MPSANTVASATTDVSAATFTPIADPAPGLGPAAAAPIVATEIPVLFVHASPDNAVAFAVKTISAQLYSALPSSPTVTTCRLACDPSPTGRLAGSASLGRHSVPLPVSFQKGLVRV